MLLTTQTSNSNTFLTDTEEHLFNYKIKTTYILSTYHHSLSNIYNQLDRIFFTKYSDPKKQSP